MPKPSLGTAVRSKIQKRMLEIFHYYKRSLIIEIQGRVLGNVCFVGTFIIVDTAPTQPRLPPALRCNSRSMSPLMFREVRRDMSGVLKTALLGSRGVSSEICTL